MSWRFRKSFKVIPGVRLNLSRSGLSASIGGAPITVNIGPHGLVGTASLPGTGISYRHKFGAVPQDGSPALSLPPSSAPSFIPTIPAPQLHPVPVIQPIQEIRSASTELLTSQSLQALKQVIQTAYEEREDIKAQLGFARWDSVDAGDKYAAWDSGFLFKRLFKKAFQKRKYDAEMTRARVQELDEQLRLTTIAAQIEMSKEQAEPFFHMRDEFAGLSECAAIWDKKSRRSVDQIRERTIANENIERQRVRFDLGGCDLIAWEQSVPHLQNANGGDLFVYPGFILYRAAKHAFSVIDFHEVTVTAKIINFVETENVPSDSQVVGQTWAKANKDGSQDRRFVNNYPIPLVRYIELTLKSTSGLWEAFQFSNPARLERFATAWNAFVTSFESETPGEKPHGVN
jgi:hypothetical protein